MDLPIHAQCIHNPRWKRRSRWRSIGFAVIVFSLSTLASCAVAEILLRVGGYTRAYVNPLSAFHQVDPVLGHRGKPNFRARFKRPRFDVRVVHDDQGFRAHENASLASAGAPTVHVLGDSFVWGWGVSQGQVMTDQLALQLPGWHVQNRGINATGTVVAHALFESSIADRLRPGDWVVLMFFNNDFADNVSGRLRAEVHDGDVVTIGPDRPFGDVFEDFLKDHSRLFNLVAFGYESVGLWRKRDRGVEHAKELVRLGDDEPQMRVTREFLSRIAEGCKTRGARFVVAYIPGQAELGEMRGATPSRLENEALFRAAFERCARDAGVDTIDLLEGFREAKATAADERLTLPEDEHWSPAGHRLAARILAEYLGQQAGGTSGLAADPTRSPR